MDHENKHYHRPEKTPPWWKTPFGMVCVFFFAVAGYFLIQEHAAHIGNNWIYLILLACPLMHMFHHGGHGEHNDNNHSNDEEGK